MRGSAVISPSTSVQISTRSAPRAAPSSAAVKSEPPRPERGGHPGGGGADKALGDRNASRFGQRREMVTSPLVQHLDVGRRPAEPLIGNQNRTDIHPIGIEAGADHGGRDQPRAPELTPPGNCVELLR